MDTETHVSGEARQVTRAAALISIGNITSRILGLLREVVKSYFFGAGGAVSAFDVAAQVPTMFYDLIVGGMLSAAFVPVFSDYARPERRPELWRLLSIVLALLVIFLGTFVLIIEIEAPLVARLLGGGLEPKYLELATQMIRITTPALLFLSISGILSGVLYALQRFELPAFVGTLSNLTMVLLVLLLGKSALGSRSLALGLLAGSVVQILFQAWALSDARLDLRAPFAGHPALRLIGKLYLPIGLGLIVDQAAVALSFNLASRTGPSGIAYMKYAAYLIQFPLGMVVTAVSIAILPTLSRYASDTADESFRATLAQGLRLVLILILPAAALLLVLAEPVVALLFQRGNFMPMDTPPTAQAVRFNLLGLIFAALDQPLIFAFYARKDTWTPALVGVVTTIFYTILAIAPALLGYLSLPALILANSLKLTAHALLMLYLFTRKMGSLQRYSVARTSRLALTASFIMVLPVLGVRLLLEETSLEGLQIVLSQVVLAGGIGALVYVVVLQQMGVEELDLIRQMVSRRGKRFARLWQRREGYAAEGSSVLPQGSDSDES
jgi:putative peptidoglycan lipid II flippase